jgi:D-sedoheptulose 7-phosphate isomerase
MPILETATSFLQALAELTLGTRVTDRSGATISLDEGANRAVRLILATSANSRKVMAIGNGGSAAIASHMQNDVCKAVGVRSLVFTEQPLLTALANDDGYETVFERPVKLWAEPGDVLVAISSSGRSQNILRAVRAAIERRCEVVTFSGFDEDNPLRSMGAVNFHVASTVYGLVENAHGAISHFITDRAMQIIQSRTTTGAEAETK